MNGSAPRIGLIQTKVRGWIIITQSTSPLLQGHTCPLSRKTHVYFAAMLHSVAVSQKTADIEEALQSFESTSKPPSLERCICILQKCRQQRNLAYAERAHRIIYASGLHTDRTLGSYIIAMFADCGSMVHAQCSFDQLDYQNDYAWTSLLQGYTHSGEPECALALLPHLKEVWFYPSSHTYQALLKACAKLKSIEGAQEIHAEVMKDGFETEPHVGSLLVDTYVKCGLLADAQEVFDELRNRDVVLWSALIAGYADRGFSKKVMNCIMQMRREGVSPNFVTFVCGMKGCKSKDMGQMMHMEILKHGFEGDPVVGHTLVDLYARHDALQEARWVFASLSAPCIIAWTALIAGHADYDACEEALIFFERMQQDKVVPDAYVFACSLRACGNVGSLNKGQSLHALAVNGGYQDETFVRNALVDMYGKCGLLLDAQNVFNKLPCQDVVLWSALLAGHAHCGKTVGVFSLFNTMVRKGVQPDRVVFLSVLAACTHAGLVETGSLCFQLMRKRYGIFQGIEHHNCLVDLAGRAGQLLEAVAMLDAMPIQPNLVTWVTLLGACRNQGNTELGQNAFEYAMKLHSKHAGSLLLAKQIFWWE